MKDTTVRIKVADQKEEDLTLHSYNHGPIKNLTVYQRSLLFAELSLISYLPKDEAEKAGRRIGFDEVCFYDRDGAQAYKFESAADCVISCRGTEAHDWNDIKADMDAVKAVSETVGLVHRGFKKEVDDLWPIIEQEISSNKKPLWFTGHSLGGAMATICAGRCKLSTIESSPEELYTYGSPRIGNKRYVNFTKITAYRWVNNNDIVAQVPPAWLGYRHTGTEMYLDYQGNLKKLTSFNRFMDGLKGFYSSLIKWRFDQLADHSMFDYVDCIHRLVLEEKKQSESK